MISTIILAIIFLLLVPLAVFFLVQFYNILFRGFAPFVSTHPLVVSRVILEARLAPGQQVYELGCGKAGFLVGLEKKFPQAKYAGIEYAFWPWFVAKAQLLLAGSKIKLIKQNLFNADIADADLIYCYLNPKMMQDLEIKFKKECKPGTQIISYCFPMTEMPPEKTIELEDNTRVYYYTI
jgi:hypothetical protein